MTPFAFSFDYVMVKSSEPPLYIVELVISFFYLIDILVGFNTSYIDSLHGDEFYKFSYIAKHYIFDGDFVIDFLSTFWF